MYLAISVRDEGGPQDDRKRFPGNDVEDLSSDSPHGGVRGGVERRDNQPGERHEPFDTSHSHSVAILPLPPLPVTIVPPPSPSPIALPSLRRRPLRSRSRCRPTVHCATAAVAQCNHAARFPSPMTLLSLSHRLSPPHRHHPSPQPPSITIAMPHIVITPPSHCPLRHHCPSQSCRHHRRLPSPPPPFWGSPS
jgi:hypothetical protein